MLKLLRNLAIKILVILMVFQIGGAFLLFISGIAFGYATSKIVDFLLPLKEEK